MAVAVKPVDALRQHIGKLFGHYTETGAGSTGVIQFRFHFRILRIDAYAAGYILPADKQATVKVGATTIVEMHNELRDTPKTGDEFNLALWVSLAAASVLGAGVLGFVGFKKKKKED